MFISRPHDGHVYFAEQPRRSADRVNGMLWSIIPVAPIAAEDRIVINPHSLDGLEFRLDGDDLVVEGQPKERRRGRQ